MSRCSLCGFEREAGIHQPVVGDPNKIFGHAYVGVDEIPPRALPKTRRDKYQQLLWAVRDFLKKARSDDFNDYSEAMQRLADLTKKVN